MGVPASASPNHHLWEIANHPDFFLQGHSAQQIFQAALQRGENGFCRQEDNIRLSGQLTGCGYQNEQHARKQFPIASWKNLLMSMVVQLIQTGFVNKSINS